MAIVNISTDFLDKFRQFVFSRIITHDDTLVYETKHAFRYLLATIIRRIQRVRFLSNERYSHRAIDFRLG